ncbi:YbaN family protein [Halioglobus maricola]|uniref:YbaN family protein n=1 Tax=Halioglobus maricola TaxID=2601894 RepID=UPI0014795B9A|nr:YbaN family protein [Halioglobus maricola]
MKRQFYKPLGFLFLGLGLAGIPLPVLPSTPFILLAAWFFARSSEKWHQRMLSSELFGPIIRNWEERRCISQRTKAMAIISMLAAGTASIAFAMESTALRIGTAVLLSIGGAVVLSIRTCPECSGPKEAE